jgi:phage-related protein
MEKVREVFIYGQYFLDFYHQQSVNVKDRINRMFNTIESTRVIPGQYFKHITGTDLYEMRISSGNNVFRVFCFFDEGKLIVVLNGFQKKTQKTPLNEIAKAIRLKKQYYENKKK